MSITHRIAGDGVRTLRLIDGGEPSTQWRREAEAWAQVAETMYDHADAIGESDAGRTLRVEAERYAFLAGMRGIAVEGSTRRRRSLTLVEAR
jgi:hypothetical protein